MKIYENGVTDQIFASDKVVNQKQIKIEPNESRNA